MYIIACLPACTCSAVFTYDATGVCKTWVYVQNSEDHVVFLPYSLGVSVLQDCQNKDDAGEVGEQGCAVIQGGLA